MSVEQDDSILELIDEKGDTAYAEIIDTFDWEDGKCYIAVVFVDEDGNAIDEDGNLLEDEAEEQVVFMEYKQGQTDQETEYLSVTDDALLDQLFAELEKRLDEESVE